MPIDPVKIPQNVYIEDRIIGPITLRQIIITGIGGGFSYVLWASVSKSIQMSGGAVSLPVTIICWIPAVIAAAFAFIKVNDLSLFRIVLLSLEKMTKAPVRVWTPRQGINIHIRTFSNEKETKAKKSTEPRPSDIDQTHNMDALTHVLDQVAAPRAKQTDATAPEEDDPLERTLSIATPLPVNRDKVKATPLMQTPGIGGVEGTTAQANPNTPQGAPSAMIRDLSPR